MTTLTCKCDECDYIGEAVEFVTHHKTSNNTFIHFCRLCVIKKEMNDCKQKIQNGTIFIEQIRKTTAESNEKIEALNNEYQKLMKLRDQMVRERVSVDAEKSD